METVKDLLRGFFNVFIDEYEIYSLRAKVLSIDTINNVCTVETIEDKSEISGVNFAAFKGAVLGFFLIPKVDSIVTVNFYNKNDAYISNASELQSLKMVFEDISANQITFEITDTGIVFNSGTLGGLVKIAEMTARFNDLEALHNALQTDFTNWTPVANDGGAALQTVLQAGYLMQTVPNSQVSDFENEKVKQ